MENFKYFRNYFGLTQEQLANNLSLDKNTVALYEAGKASPSIKVLIQLIDVYGISLDYFLTGSNCFYPKNLKLLLLAMKLDNVLHSEQRSNIESSAKSLLGNNFNVELQLKQDLINIELVNNFHKNLKEIRNLKKLKQLEISNKLGFSKNLLAQYESKSYPSIERLIELSNFFNISLHALVLGQKLYFQFTDGYFGKTMLLADHLLSLEDHKILIRLMESALSNKT